MGFADIIQIGGQKTFLSEQLVRAEGYNISSSIENGMGRMVDVLEVMGLWGNDSGSTGKRKRQPMQNNKDWSAGGKIDTSYQRRLNYQKMLESGKSADSALNMDTGTKILTARKRIQARAGIASQGGQLDAVALIIQQSPEWLRPLLQLLPASCRQMAILGKPPPHLVESAVSTLRSCTHPAEQPARGSIPRKRQRKGDDSDDNGNDLSGGGGYRSQF